MLQVILIKAVPLIPHREYDPIQCFVRLEYRFLKMVSSHDANGFKLRF